MKFKLLPVFALYAINSAAHAVELAVQSAVGHDSNPFTLADTFDPDSSTFVENKLAFRQEFNDLRFSVRVTDRRYDRADSRADHTSWKTDARYKQSYRLWGNKTRSSIAVGFGAKDKTYVSHSTGNIGQFGGLEIGDRYDYTQWFVKTKTRMKLNKSVKTTLTLKYNNKDYEDYAIQGLSNLDYTQYSLSNAWAYSFDKANSLSSEMSYEKRTYDDKRQKETGGLIIDNSDLAYSSFGLEVGFEHKFSKALSFGLAFAYKEREDNGAGYYDKKDKRVSADLDYASRMGLELGLALGYRDTAYVNSNAFDPNNDGEPSKHGYFVAIETNKTLKKWAGKPSVFAKIKYDDYDSDQANYEYDRLQAQLGLALKFGS